MSNSWKVNGESANVREKQVEIAYVAVTSNLHLSSLVTCYLSNFYWQTRPNSKLFEGSTQALCAYHCYAPPPTVWLYIGEGIYTLN